MAESSLAPTLLVAMPQMLDPNFSRSVVLLCRSSSEGAMGLVVNRPSESAVSGALNFDPPLRSDSGVTVWVGGPVEPQRGWLLLGYDPGLDEGIAVADGIFLSSSMLLLRNLVEAGDRVEQHGRFFAGYSGWGGGQLEGELAASAWLTTEVSREIIFDTPAELMWEAAIRGLGIDPFALQAGGGVH